MRRRLVKTGHLGISEERVWPPDLLEHLVAYAQFILVAGPGEVESRVVPVLTEIEVHREVLRQSLSIWC